jgi:hypothetical protein
MPGNPLVRFDEGRVGRTCKVSPSLLRYRLGEKSCFFTFGTARLELLSLTKAPQLTWG